MCARHWSITTSFCEAEPTVTADIAGRKATKALQTILSDKYEVVDDPPQYGKDVNDFLCKRLGIKDKTERSFAR